MKKPRIKAHWQGFVPAWIPWPRTMCAYYHCKMRRDEGSRFCVEHCSHYEREVYALGDAPRVIAFEVVR